MSQKANNDASFTRVKRQKLVQYILELKENKAAAYA